MSTKTVSRATNGDAHVAAETVERVRRVCWKEAVA